MGYLFDRNNGVYIHEALVDENGHYDADLLNEARVSSVHTSINRRTEYNKGKFDKQDSKDMKNIGSTETYAGNKRQGYQYDSPRHHGGISPANRTQRKHGMKGYLAQQGSTASWAGDNKESDEKAKRQAKSGVKESFDYSTEFFSNLELK